MRHRCNTSKLPKITRFKENKLKANQPKKNQTNPKPNTHAPLPPPQLTNGNSCYFSAGLKPSRRARSSDFPCGPRGLTQHGHIAAITAEERPGEEKAVPWPPTAECAAGVQRPP